MKHSRRDREFRADLAFDKPARFDDAVEIPMQTLREATDLAERYRRARCVFFDCDGVIFDSNEFKIDAMRHALAEYPEPVLDEMVRYWRANGGVSRWAKFRHFFEEIVREPEVAPKLEHAVERFGDASLRAYATHSPKAEALELAKHAGAARCYVVSGAAQTELHTVFAQKRIDGYFARVLGSPPAKLELVRSVLRELDAQPSEALLIGDGGGDFRVCAELGVHFVYLDEFSEWQSAKSALSKAPNVTWAEDWPRLMEALKL